MEELPNTQQAAPVNDVASPDQTDTRVTEAMTEGQTEPAKVEADEAIDTTTLETVPEAHDHPVDTSHETQVAPVENPVMDDPQYAGGDQTDTRVTKTLDEGEKEPQPVDAKNAIAEPQEDQLTDEQKKMDHPPVSPAEPEKKKAPVRRGRAKKVEAEPAEDKKADKADDKQEKKLNPKLARLAKNRSNND